MGDPDLGEEQGRFPSSRGQIFDAVWSSREFLIQKKMKEKEKGKGKEERREKRKKESQVKSSSYSPHKYKIAPL